MPPLKVPLVLVVGLGLGGDYKRTVCRSNPWALIKVQGVWVVSGSLGFRVFSVLSVDSLLFRLFRF